MTKRVAVCGMAISLLFGMSGGAEAAVSDREASALLTECRKLTRAHEYEKARALLRGLLAEEGLGANRVVQASDALVTTYCWERDFAGALKALDEIPEVTDPRAKARFAKLRGWACEGAGRPEEALAAAREAVAQAAKVEGGEKPEVVAGYQMLVVKSLMKLRRYEEAGKACALAVAANPTPEACGMLAQVSLEVGDPTAALQAWLILCQQEKAQIADVRKIGAGLAEATKTPAKCPSPEPITKDRAAWLAATATRCEIMHEIQWMLVNILLTRGETDQALVEARSLLAGCPQELLPQTTERISLLLKTIDGNVARANLLLSRLRWGKDGPDGEAGTEDDLPDPFAGGAEADNPGRDAAIGQAVAAQKDDWRGCLARSTLYRYWGRPKQALPELQKALRLAPMEQESIGRILGDTMQVLVEVSGQPQVAEQFADYQRYGTAGRDGKKGTDDDLADPLPQWLGK